MVMDSLENAINDAQKIKSMRKAFETVKKRQKRLALQNFEERRTKLREMKEFSSGNNSLIDETAENLNKNGFSVKLASSKKEAIKLILEEVKGETLVVKSKSKTLNSLGLIEKLAEHNIKTIETDIGDRILQLSGETSFHPTGPACHLTRHDVATVLSKHLGVPINSDPSELINILKGEIVENLMNAKIGITGANAITAEEGSVVLVHNEGNIIEVMTRPKKHIIVAGTDKIVPNLEDALNLIKLQIYCATGSKLTSHINILGGPTKTADIEKKLFTGIHGPREISLILIEDNSEIPEEYRELLFCIGCGACLLDCPVYSVFGNKFGDKNEGHGGRGVLLSALLEKNRISANHKVFNCLECGKCSETCPAKIDTRGLIAKIKKDNPPIPGPYYLNKVYTFGSSHSRYLRRVVVLKYLDILNGIMTALNKCRFTRTLNRKSCD